MSQLRIGECSSHWPGVRFSDGVPARSISDLPRSMPRSRAVLPRPAGGVTSHITAVTTRDLDDDRRRGFAKERSCGGTG